MIFLRHIWPDSTETHFTVLKSTGIPLFTSVPQIWNSHTSGESRYQIMRELPHKWKLKLHHVGDPIKKTCRPVQVRIHHSCVELVFFRWKGQCATEIQLLNTPHDRLSGRQAMTPLWCSSTNTLCFPKKKLARALSRAGVGGDSDTCHQVYVVAWQRWLRLLSIQALICS